MMDSYESDSDDPTDMDWNERGNGRAKKTKRKTKVSHKSTTKPNKKTKSSVSKQAKSKLIKQPRNARSKKISESWEPKNQIEMDCDVMPTRQTRSMAKKIQTILNSTEEQSTSTSQPNSSPPINNPFQETIVEESKKRTFNEMQNEHLETSFTSNEPITNLFQYFGDQQFFKSV